MFQRFIMILTEHLLKCDTNGIPFDNYWYKYTVGRLQQVFLAVSIINMKLKFFVNSKFISIDLQLMFTV